MRKSEGVLLDGGGRGPRWQGSVLCCRAACHAGPSQLVPYRFLLSGFRLVIPHLTPPHRGMPSAPPGRQTPGVTHS